MQGISVVIPTIYRPSLEIAIAAVIAAAEHVDEPVELIVVDDRHGAARPADPGEERRGRVPVRRLRTSDAGVNGPSAARNLGIASASFDLIAFVDDDARCDEGWLAAGLARLRAEPQIAGVEGAVHVDPTYPLDPVRSRLVLNIGGGGYLTASLFARTEAARRIGGFRAIAADSSGRQFPFREDTDFGLRLARAAGPVPFEPRAVVFHPPEAVGLRRLVRLGRMFSADAAMARLHPEVVPSLRRRPLARLRIRAATALTLLAPGLAWRRTRLPVGAAMLLLAGAVSAQFEVEVRAAGIRRSAPRTILDTIRRLPRSLVWSLAAGSARLQGEVMVRLGLITIASDQR